MSRYAIENRYADRTLSRNAAEKLLLATNWLEVTYYGAKQLISKELVDTRNYNERRGTIEIKTKPAFLKKLYRTIGSKKL